MGTTFVTADGETGFWMRDGVLELWLRLLALHIEETPEIVGRAIRDDWLLASQGWFQGCVPHRLEHFVKEPQGEAVIRRAIASLMAALRTAPAQLNVGILTLLGIEGWTNSRNSNYSFATSELMDVGDAFIKLLDQQITDTAESTAFMPGAPRRSAPHMQPGGFVSDHLRVDARSLALHRLVATKIAGDPALLDVARANIHRWRAAGSGPMPALAEWESILDGPADGVIAVITGTSETATRLRQSSPFTGILSDAERAAVYESFSIGAYYPGGQPNLR